MAFAALSCCCFGIHSNGLSRKKYRIRTNYPRSSLRPSTDDILSLFSSLPSHPLCFYCSLLAYGCQLFFCFFFSRSNSRRTSWCCRITCSSSPDWISSKERNSWIVASAEIMPSPRNMISMVITRVRNRFPRHDRKMNNRYSFRDRAKNNPSQCSLLARPFFRGRMRRLNAR